MPVRSVEQQSPLSGSLSPASNMVLGTEPVCTSICWMSRLKSAASLSFSFTLWASLHLPLSSYPASGCCSLTGTPRSHKCAMAGDRSLAVEPQSLARLWNQRAYPHPGGQPTMMVQPYSGYFNASLITFLVQPTMRQHSKDPREVSFPALPDRTADTLLKTTWSSFMRIAIHSSPCVSGRT